MRWCEIRQEGFLFITCFIMVRNIFEDHILGILGIEMVCVWYNQPSL